MSVRITIVGSGYVGLVSGACLAEIGHDVVCVDKDQWKIQSLVEGRIPIYEPGLDELVARNVARGRLRFSADLGASVRGCEAVFIAVGTPSDGTSGKADLSFVFAAAEEVARNLDGFAVVISKSTVPVGTNRKVAAILAEHCAPGVGAAVASNPEFLREGAAINDFMSPDRVVVGAEDARALALMGQIYAPLVAGGARLLMVGIEAAEVIKYAANAFLAVKISFVNEIADLCEAVGADIGNVVEGLGSDRRIGPGFLQVGPGWGGSCFPKDTRALDATAREHGLRLLSVEASMAANSARKIVMADRIRAACAGGLQGKRVALLGLTFKGQTDDMRESPTLDVAPILLAQGASVCAFDPSHPHEAGRLLPGVTLAATHLEAARDADVLVVMTDWEEFAHYDLAGLAAVMADPVLVDLRNLYNADQALNGGFRRYVSLGRPDAECEPADVLAVANSNEAVRSPRVASGL
jgi:UDPglucose 6-dehydrogenase